MGDVKLNSTVEENDFGVILSETLHADKQCLKAANKASQILRMIEKTFVSCNYSVTLIPLYKYLVRPQLDYCGQVWRLHVRKDVKVIKRV